MIREWLIVMNADGTVLAVDGGAPCEWVGTRLEERTDVPAELRRTAAELRRHLSTVTDAGPASATAMVDGNPVRILVVHALPVRWLAVDLRALLESTTKVMEPQARAIEVALAVDVSPDVPQTLRLDPEKIAWALTALIGNALRFVRRGTRLMPGGTIRVHARRASASSHVALEVQDDGSGIPADKLPHLLHRSAAPLQPGVLALSLVQDLIAAHGGEIQIESSTEADRSGTTVRLILPCP